MNRKRWAISSVVIFLLLTAVGVAWLAYDHFRPKESTTSQGGVVANDPFKYVVLEKIVVMLKAETHERTSRYVVLDIILKTKAKNQVATTDQSLVLKSIAVQSLSRFTLQEIREKSVADVTDIINKAFTQSYRCRRVVQPFAAAIIGKLLAD